MDEKMKEVGKQMFDRKQLKKQLNECEIKARKECKPFCSTCYKMDAEKNKLKDYSFYTKGFVIVKESDSKLKEFSKKEPGVMYKLIDYKCPKGHNFSLMYHLEDWESINKKVSKKKSDE